MIALVQWFEASGMTQAQAAKSLGITQPRFNQLLKGKIEIFSLDALVNMATSAGMRVGLSFSNMVSLPRADYVGGAEYPETSLYSGVSWVPLGDGYSFNSAICWEIARPYPCAVNAVEAFLHTQDR